MCNLKELPFFYGLSAGHEFPMLSIDKGEGNLIGYCGTKDNGSFEGQEIDHELNNGNPCFEIDEWEVFKIEFQQSDELKLVDNNA